MQLGDQVITSMVAITLSHTYFKMAKDAIYQLYRAIWRPQAVRCWPVE